MTDKKKKQPNMIMLGLFMGVLGAISAGLLAGADILTKKPIKEAALKKTSTALKEVLPPFNNVPANEKIEIKATNGTKVVFYLAKMDNKIVGIAGEGYSNKGFNGNVTVMLGLDPKGTIQKVIVTKQGETPGLGTVVTDRKREKTIFDLFSSKKKETGLPPNKILDAFDGHTALPNSKKWTVKKDGGQFEFVTGATITSRAVTDAVYTVDSTFTANITKITGSPEKK
jgi:electron transport complex protein RnfG